MVSLIFLHILFLHHLTSETNNNKALVQKHHCTLTWYRPLLLLLLPSFSELIQDIHRSYSELLPSCSELKHDKHCSYSELLSSYSGLKHDTHHSYSELLPNCSELKHDIHCSYCIHIYVYMYVCTDFAIIKNISNTNCMVTIGDYIIK